MNAHPVETYVYRAADGSDYVCVDRYEPKTFRPRLPGATHPGLPTGHPRILYRLPEVLDAVAEGRTIYLVEGEKDADTGAAIGMVTTTMLGGVGGWNAVRDHAVAALHGANVVIVADRDDAGRKHARQAFDDLVEHCADVRIVEPAHGKDLSDHVDDGGFGRNELLDVTPTVERIPNAPAPSRFKPWKVSELLAAPLHYEWDVVGMHVRPTYGMDSGELKSLKSYFATARHIGMAAGVPILGHWKVPERRRVLVYAVEGGRIPWTRRLVRLSEAHGVEPGDLDDHLRVIFDAGPLDSQEFRDSLRRHLDEFGPHFVQLDPLYPFQPITVSSNQLSQVGPMLAEIQQICAEHGATFWVTAHMNQTGQGFDLKRVTGAGPSEWADSWCLLRHRETADVPAGIFRLEVQIGSRQWGGGSYDLDLNIGRLDVDNGTHDGPITFNVAPSNGTSTSTTTTPAKDSHAKFLDAQLEVLRITRAARRPLSTKEIIDRAHDSSPRKIRAAIPVLVDRDALTSETIPNPDPNAVGKARMIDVYTVTEAQ